MAVNGYEVHIPLFSNTPQRAGLAQYSKASAWPRASARKRFDPHGALTRSYFHAEHRLAHVKAVGVCPPPGCGQTRMRRYERNCSKGGQ